MKRTIVFAGVVLTALAFNGCNNEAAVKEAEAKCTKLTATKDSLIGVAQTELTTVKATYDAQIQALNDTIAAREAASAAAAAKKPAAAKPAAKPATTPKPAEKPKVTSR